MQSFKLAGGLGLLFIGLVGLLTSANAAFIRTQNPCVNSAGYCLYFDWLTTPLPVVRSFAYVAPAGSTAQVTFHGSFLCTITANSKVKRVADITSQIVPTAATAVNHNGRSGLRHVITIDYDDGDSINGSASFNLASTRDFYNPTAGTQYAFFKLAKLRMDPDVRCYVYNATFSVVVTP